MRSTIPNTGEFGLIADQAPQEIPVNAWSDVQNFRFRDGKAERMLGQKSVFATPVVTPYFVTPYGTSTARFWITAGLTRVFADDGTSRTEITGAPLLGSIEDRWTGGSLNGVLVLNNGRNIPRYWGGNTATTLVDLTGWTSTWRAASIRPFKNYLVALDVTKGSTRYPHMVKWSAAADPGTIPVSWNEADPSIDAGELDLAETPDLLVDCLPLGDVNIIYKERSMYAMQYIGGEFIFRFQRLPGNYGMLSRGCAANTPNGHVVLSAGDVVLHNGQGPQSILTAKVRNWLFSQIDSDNYKRCFVTSNPSRNEVWICFPEALQTSCTKALVWNWVDGTFGVRGLQNVTYGASGQLDYSLYNNWDGDTDSWDSDVTPWNTVNETASYDTRLLLCSENIDVSAVDASNTNNGTNVSAYVERIGLVFDAPDKVKTIKRIIPRVDAVAGTVITIEVGGSMSAEVDPTWQPAVTYTVGTSYQANLFATGRYLGVRFSSTGVNSWSIRSYDIEYEVRGSY